MHRCKMQLWRYVGPFLACATTQAVLTGGEWLVGGPDSAQPDSILCALETGSQKIVR